MKYSEFFDRRKHTFEESFARIQRAQDPTKPYILVELGTSRSFVTGNYPGCCNPNPIYWYPDQPEKWDWGAGIFTKVFSDNLEGSNYLLYTIDPSDSAIQIVTTMCGNNPSVHIVHDYSTHFLRTFKEKIDFLYMDHMESGEEACLQHLEDSKLIVEMDIMSENGIILIDDVEDNIHHTKGKYSIPYLLQHGYKQILHEYQVLLVKETSPIQTSPIPKLFFQTFETDTFSEQFQHILNSWKEKNPNYEYRFFKGSDRDAFMKANFDARTYNAYKKIIPGAYKADMWRYAVLYVYGGVYADIDTICMNPIDNFLTPEIEFMTVVDFNHSPYEGKHNLSNSWIASVPKHDILKNCIQHIVYNIENNVIPLSKLDFCGPGMLGRHTNLYLQREELDSFIGKEGRHSTVCLLKFEPNTEYVKDLKGNILFQNKNGNPLIQHLYKLECQKANVISWLTSRPF